MDLRLYDTLIAREAGVPPARSGQCAHVCVRADGLRLRPYRQCAPGDRVRRAVPPAAPSLRRRPRHLRPQHHRRRRQDQRARGGGISASCRSTRRSARSPKRPTANSTTTSPRSAACRRRSSRARPSTSPKCATLIERLVKSGNAYVADGQCPVQRALDAGLRPAVEAAARRDDRRRPRRSRAPTRKTRRTSCCGSRRSRANRPGRHPPASPRPAVPAGTSNARRCRGNISAKLSISTAAASISSFPHHEDEIAQSRCAFHTPVMANFWMHNGFLQVEGEKMSKSLGNFVTINELLQDWPGEVVRFTMLQTHYRQPINWTVVGLREAQKTSIIGTGSPPTPRRAICAPMRSMRSRTTSTRRKPLPPCTNCAARPSKVPSRRRPA